MLTITLFYPFEAILNVTFLYPLNTSENICEFWSEMWQMIYSKIHSFFISIRVNWVEAQYA